MNLTRPIIIISLALLSACATPADPGRMTLAPAPADVVYPAPLRAAMCVRSVTGGEETNPLWVSKVNSADFKSALVGSMAGAGLIAPENSCKFPVDVNLLGMSQPSIGLDMQVTSHANYKVANPAGQQILLATISEPFTATFSDAAIGFVRVKRANEGSVRASISRFLEKLRGVTQF